MKIRLIRREIIDDYIAADPGGRSTFGEWLSRTKHGRFSCLADLKDGLGPLTLLGKDSHRIVFNIGQNSFRLICIYVFDRQCIHLIVCWIGSCQEYYKLTDMDRQNIMKVF